MDGNCIYNWNTYIWNVLCWLWTAQYELKHFSSDNLSCSPQSLLVSVCIYRRFISHWCLDGTDNSSKSSVSITFSGIYQECVFHLSFCLTYSSEASTHLIDQAAYGMFALIVKVLALIKGPQACVGSSLDSIDSPRCSSPTLALCQLYFLINDRRFNKSCINIISGVGELASVNIWFGLN